MGDEAKAGVAIGTTALIAAAVAILANRPKGAGGPSGQTSLDEAAMNLLLAIAQSGSDIEQRIAATNALLGAMTGGGLPGVVGLENPPEITAFRVIPVAVNFATRLPDRKIPYGMELVIKAENTNGGIIYVANSAAEVTNPNSSYTLIGNEAVEYKVSTSYHIWISSTVLGEGVVCTVEQAGGG